MSNSMSTRVRCSMRINLSTRATEGEAEEGIRNDILLLHLPLVAVCVIFLPAGGRYAEAGVLVDGQPQQFEIWTKVSETPTL